MTETPLSDSPGIASPSGPNAAKASASPPRKGVSFKLAAALLVMATFALTIGWATLPLWIGALPPQLSSAAEILILHAPESEAVKTLRVDVAVLQNAVDSLRKKNNDLQLAVETLQENSANHEHAKTTARLAALEGAVAKLNAAEANKGRNVAEADKDRNAAEAAPADRLLDVLRSDVALLKASVTALTNEQSQQRFVSGRLNRLEETIRTLEDLKRQDFLLALLQLRAAVDGGKPFAAPLTAVSALAPADQRTAEAFKEMAPWANRGIPTLAHLQWKLDSLEAAIIRANLVPEDATNWFKGMLMRFASLVSVSRIDQQAGGDSSSALLQRAASSLKRGDLEQAVAELEKLSGHAAAEASEWLNEAKIRVRANQIMDDLTDKTLLGRTQASPTSKG